MAWVVCLLRKLLAAGLQQAVRGSGAYSPSYHHSWCPMIRWSMLHHSLMHLNSNAATEERSLARSAPHLIARRLVMALLQLTQTMFHACTFGRPGAWISYTPSAGL